MSSRQTNRGGRVSDLAVVVGLVVLADVALLVPGIPQGVEWAVGIPFLLVLPGYAFVSALLPESPRATDGTGGRGPGWVARTGLALAASVVLVAVVGVVASATVGIQLRPTVIGVSLLTAAFALVAAVRRRSLPPGRRANPLGSGVGPSLGIVSGTRLQTAVFAVALIGLVAAVAFAGTAQPGGQSSYTEFYVLNETGNGTLVANDYPTEMTAGQETPLHVGIENVEHQPTSYEVVVRARSLSNGTESNVEQLDRFEVQLDHGERAIVNRTVVPQTVGDSRQVQLLLYKGGAPANASVESADLSLRMWVAVVEPTP